jgi:hypothetical protein
LLDQNLSKGEKIRKIDLDVSCLESCFACQAAIDFANNRVNLNNLYQFAFYHYLNLKLDIEYKNNFNNGLYLYANDDFVHALFVMLLMEEEQEAKWLTNFAFNDSQRIGGDAFKFACWLERMMNDDHKKSRNLYESIRERPYQKLIEGWNDNKLIRSNLREILDYHARQIKYGGEFEDGVFSYWPIEIYAIQKIRKLQNLETKLPKHWLLETPFFKPLPDETPDVFTGGLYNLINSVLIDDK